MAENMKAYVSLIPSAQGFGSKLHNQLSPQVSRSGRSLGGVFGKAFAGIAAIGIGAKAFNFGKSIVSAASEAQQSVGATETVFERFADTVIRRSNAAAQAVGLSANDYRGLANVLGASLKSAGLPLKQVTGLTGDLTKRAADLAATFGGSTKSAIEAISSLLRGEMDPIERYGVSIKQADVNARLAAEGLDNLTGAELKQAEMQARLALLFEQTADAAGTFARESNTLEGQQQRLAASWENTKTSLGQALLPALTSLAGVLNEHVVPAVNSAWKWAGQNLLPTLQNIGGFIREELFPALRAFAQDYLEGARRALAEFTAKGKDGKSVLDSIKTAFKTVWPVIRDKVLPVVGEFYKIYLPALAKQLATTVTAISKGIEVIRGLVGAFKEGVKAVKNFAGAVKERLETVVKWFTDLPGNIKGAFGDAKSMLKRIGEQIVEGLLAGIRAVADKVTQAVEDVVSKIPKKIRSLMGISSPSKVTMRLGEFIGEGLAVGVEKSRPKLVKALEKTFDTLKNRLSQLVDQFKSIRDTVADAFTGNLFEGVNTVDFIGNMFETRGRLQGLVQAFKKLTAQGYTPKFLTALFQSGNAGLIMDLANNPTRATEVQTLFDEIGQFSGQLGQAVAQNQLGPKLDDVRAELKGVREDLRILRAVMERQGKEIGKELNRSSARAAQKSAVSLRRA